MKNISDITDPGASFDTELQKDISICPLNLQQNDHCALEVHRITVAMELKSSKSDSSLGIDIQRFNSVTGIVLVNQPCFLHHGKNWNMQGTGITLSLSIYSIIEYQYLKKKKVLEQGSTLCYSQALSKDLQELTCSHFEPEAMGLLGCLPLPVCSLLFWMRWGRNGQEVFTVAACRRAKALPSTSWQTWHFICLSD